LRPDLVISQQAEGGKGGM